ncbi:DUF192 domain-containing protein [Roseateles asaccharophilus]|uniref:Uncharacterized membrane protein (UPF0127 family) n=1 Tax=Roseateles asaccharophilus TaxID=582607 RepID=A0ABU2A428_9BURK|nr:DUF192 domain-containing protein [Roseateles asaccharophilus]MDR7331949.1 uncharacterized membrane protein (UPF0127 family) [Roseateles asaccharophilus]
MTCIKALAFAALTLLASVASAQDSAQQLRSIPLTAGMHVIQAEVAQTDRERAIGLMHRKTMPTNNGMLFVFEDAQPQCFWMRNTLLPLSIAFIADDGSIVNIADMKPLDETSHCSTKPVRFALEMNQGWFAKKGIKAGTKLKGQPFN